MSADGVKLYGSLAWFSFRNHLGNWRYIASRLISFVFFALVIGAFWRAVIAQGTRVFAFDGNDIVWHCGVGQLIAFASPRIFVRIEDDVLSGNIAYYLTRPVNYIEMRLAEGIGGMMANLIIFLPVGFIACYLYTQALPRGSIPFTVLFIILGSSLHMFFQILVGFAGVWLHEVQLPYRIYQKITIVMGGLEVPISVYPAWAQYASWATPFGLIFARPCNAIYNPDPAVLMQGLFFMLAWVAVIFALVIGSYRRVHQFICLNGG